MDTFDLSHTALEMPPPPSAHASVEERIDFLNQQLDSIGMEKAILNGLHLLGNGRNQRLQGGEQLVCFVVEWWKHSTLTAAQSVSLLATEPFDTATKTPEDSACYLPAFYMQSIYFINFEL
jgi:hypothetical protein